MSVVQQPIFTVEQAYRGNQSEAASTLRDGDLLKQAQAGSQIAFEALVERYRSSLHHFIARYLGDPDQRYDILQQVLLQLFLSLQNLRTDRTLQAWLFQVAHNRCIDALRCRHALNFSELANEKSEEKALLAEGASLLLPSVEDQAEQHEVQEIIYQAIFDLPQKYRAIVWLRYTTLLNFGEIGRILHIPESTAETYFHRAKLRLRQSLRQLKD